ncbi:hypothetical protein EJ04DRAFT_132934 [Polyplosphaeria fusca]|uniref:Uncharacterized protein n=1 Tax=Polyplosphaeria fusca TaxID=682080 RepID=A0A9P4QMP2_9PLEO|nr:hypothetical protein EJ04DRAFT_132934 [Polyplosphaeria fusca]
MEPLRVLPSVSSTSAAGCWLNMFNGGYVLAQGFPVPPREIGRGIELPFDMMVEQAMAYHAISHDRSIVLKGRYTALIPTLATHGPSGEVQWHLIGRKPKVVKIDPANGLKGQYLTDVEFSVEDHDLSWKDIDDKKVKPCAVSGIEGLVGQGRRMFVGYFPKANIILGTRGSSYESLRKSGAGYVEGNVIKFEQAMTVTVGTNFGTGGLLSTNIGSRIRRPKYDNTPKQVPALIGDQLRNRHNRPHILYDVHRKTAWMIPEACVILYLIHRWASLQLQALDSDCLQETQGIPQDPASSEIKEQSSPSAYRENAGDEIRSYFFDYMPFIEESSHGGSKAAEAILRNCRDCQELPRQIRSLEKPHKPVYFANIVFRVYLILDALIEHQKRKKPGFLQTRGDHPYMWGYELDDVAGFDKAPAKKIKIDKVRSGGWYGLVNPDSEIAILFGEGLGEMIRFNEDPMLCHHWRGVPEGHDYLSTDGEVLQCLLDKLNQQRGPKFFLSDTKDGISTRDGPKKCKAKEWPCCDMTLQLKSKSSLPRAPAININAGEAVVIGYAVRKLQKLTDRGIFQERTARHQVLDAPSRGMNGAADGVLSREELRGDPADNVAAEFEVRVSADDDTFVTCEEDLDDICLV